MRATDKLLLAIPMTLLACTDFVEPEAVEPEAAASPEAGVRAPRGLVRHADAIPSSYIVVLKAHRSAAGRDATIDRLMQGRATRIAARFAHALDGFAATLDEQEAIELAADPEVAFVEENARIYTTATSQNNATWGIDRIDQATLPLDTSYTYLDSGEGVTAYVFDSGIRATHGEFTARILPGFAGIDDGQGTNDCNQHGTHVSGTIGGTVFGVAKKVTIVPVRVLGCDATGTVAAAIAGIDWVLANKRPRAVANMSLGGTVSDAEDAAVRRLIAAGIPVVVSAGNNNVDACTQSPARVTEAITVAATDANDARATFSNFGSCVDLFAPGVDIVAASYTSDTLTRTLSGTSMSAPHVTGAVAMYLAAHPTATPTEVEAALIAGTTPGKVADPRGSPNQLLATRFVDSTAPSASITSPANGAEVAESFMVTAEASDPNLASVRLLLDGVEVETRSSGPFTFEVSAPPGTHTLELVAVDAATRSSSSTVTIAVAEDSVGPDDGDDAPPGSGDLVGGCSAGGHASGVLLALALAGLRRRRRDRDIAVA